MTAAWIAVLAVGAATIAIKGAGTLVFADRPLPRGVAAVMPLLAPALLAALVVGQTAADGQALVVDARLAGGAIAIALTPIVPPGLPIVAAALGAVIALSVRA